MASDCVHCRGAEYVFEYWLEKFLDQNHIHMTEIPSEVFEKIPIELLKFCHCNIRLAFFPNDKIVRCLECEGTTWCFTEHAEKEGYRWKKTASLSTEEIRVLPCEYFERCSCGIDEKGTKTPKKKKAVKELFDLLKIKLPEFGFGFPSLCGSLSE